MKIFTSNYARKGNDPNSVAISRSIPNWFEGRHVPELAPEWNMILGFKQGIVSQEVFTQYYIQKIERSQINWDRLLESFSNPTYLLCYETPGAFCHRHVLAEWLNIKHNLSITEWQTPTEHQEQLRLEFVDSLLEF